MPGTSPGMTDLGTGRGNDGDWKKTDQSFGRRFRRARFGN
jgi:hypothetical protein